MNLKDLWIGEKVSILSSGKTGVFIGINKDGKARIKTGDKILLVYAVNLAVEPEKDTFPDIHQFILEEDRNYNKVKPLKVNINHTLDLHLEKLAPHLLNELPSRILEYQLQKSDEFIRQAIAQNFPHITIIHGKGQGVLKLAIEHQLEQFRQIRFTFSKNGGGAVEVWL